MPEGAVSLANNSLLFRGGWMNGMHDVRIDSFKCLFDCSLVLEYVKWLFCLWDTRPMTGSIQTGQEIGCGR